jgi:curli biogenesis system outer membrane secretion channel CsgG
MRKTAWFLAVIFTVVCFFSNPALAYKPRVAVYGFETKASSGFWHDAKWDIGTGMAEMLSDALVNTGKFNVVERINLNDITTE